VFLHCLHSVATLSICMVWYDIAFFISATNIENAKVQRTHVETVFWYGLHLLRLVQCDAGTFLCRLCLIWYYCFAMIVMQAVCVNFSYLDNRVFVSLANGDITVYVRDHSK
jgi:hypothetical protein